MKRMFMVGLVIGAVLAMLPFACAMAEEALELPQVLSGLNCVMDTNATVPAQIRPQMTKEGKAYLFLPSCADLTRLTFHSEAYVELTAQCEGKNSIITMGEPFDLMEMLASALDEDGTYVLSLSDGRGNDAVLHIMRSANQAAIWLVSDDPENQGRAYVEAAKADEKIAVRGSMTMLDEDGEMVYSGALRELRGRGNTTWSHREKKPYQIKLDQKTDLLNTGEDNTARTWVLLAEAYDGSLLHNTITLALGKELGLAGTPECRPVDLYYDGEYRGFYLLAEKVDVNSGRLDIFDYSSYMEEQNPDISDGNTYPQTKAENEYGNVIAYTEGAQSDMEGEGAYLVELDKYSYQNEPSWFWVYDAVADFEVPFVLKSPKYATQADVEYISVLMQELVDAVVNEGYNPITGSAVSEYADIDSLARLMVIHQLAKTMDVGNTSTFFYIPQGESVFYSGPLWDFDIGYGNREGADQSSAAEGYVPFEGWMRLLLALPDVQTGMKAVFFDELSPLVQNVLLGEEEAQSGALRSLDEYARRLENSYQMNAKLWNDQLVESDNVFETLEENIRYLRGYLTERMAWLNRDMGLWYGGELDRMSLRVAWDDENAQETAAAEAANLFAQYEVGEVRVGETTEGGSSVEIDVILKEELFFAAEPEAWVNGEPAEIELLSENEAIVRWFGKSGDR